MRIDSHHHLWKYGIQEYGWIGDDMKAIQRDFLAPELAAALKSGGIDGAVTVQARETLEETRWLLGIAAKAPIIKGVVGWVELVNPKVEADLEKFSADKKLKGVRHVLQAEPANQLMDDPRFNAGVEKLDKHGLVYDVLIFERHLKQAIAFVDRHPRQRFVLDHVAKPKIKEHVLEPWRTLMKDLAKRPNIYCKISGMATEADWKGWTAADMKPYIDTVLEAFGPKRLMFGSDWPVMLVASPYRKWVDTVAAAIGKLSAAEQARIWGETAAEAYRL
ncbi:MAG: amidohydrolase family protein [Bryobacteraceae bacterium]